MPKNRRVVKEICLRLGSSCAEKMSAAHNLLREKLLKRELGSIRHYGYENAQKQASCVRSLSEIGQLGRGEEAGCPKSSSREVIKEGIGKQKTLWT